VNGRVSRLIAGWRTGLSRPVLILQAGNALNHFGYGLVLPFEIMVLQATLIHSELAATGLLAGVAIVFALGEIARILVLGPLVTVPAGAVLFRPGGRIPDPLHEAPSRLASAPEVAGRLGASFDSPDAASRSHERLVIRSPDWASKNSIDPSLTCRWIKSPLFGAASGSTRAMMFSFRASAVLLAS
jgi:hypothetical protein